jgi:hypothetical protein
MNLKIQDSSFLGMTNTKSEIEKSHIRIQDSSFLGMTKTEIKSAIENQKISNQKYKIPRSSE